METINGRIQYIVDKFYGGNESAFCRDTDLGQSTVNGILGARKNSPNSKTLNKILNIKEIQISSDWMISGRGDLPQRVDLYVPKKTESLTEIEKCDIENKLLKEQLAEMTAKYEELLKQKAVQDYLLKIKPAN